MLPSADELGVKQPSVGSMLEKSRRESAAGALKGLEAAAGGPDVLVTGFGGLVLDAGLLDAEVSGFDAGVA